MKKNSTQLLLKTFLFFWVSTTIFAQDLPKFINITEDLREIKTESGNVTGFYNESKLRKIYLEFSDSDYWSQLEANYDTDVYVKATLKYEDEVLIDVGVQFKGNTSYNKLSDAAEKMSFSIKTDLFVDGQDINGYSNLNLNNAYEDNSTIREVVYANLCRKHIPAPQANFVELYINNEYWGPYANVQQVNKDLLEDWFMSNDGARFRADASTTANKSKALPPPGGGGGGGGGPQWGDGTAALNYLGSDISEYQKYYSLKSSDIENSWEKLVAVCDVLNNTPINNLEETVKSYLDVDRTLWMLAFNNVMVNLDSYSGPFQQNYYLVKDDNGRFLPIVWDLNQSMGSFSMVSTGGGGPGSPSSITDITQMDLFLRESDNTFPLIAKLLNVPRYKKMYTAHCKTMLEENISNNDYYVRAEFMQNIKLDDMNAIDIVVEIIKHVHKSISNLPHSAIYDLQKYYPKSWGLLEEFKSCSIIDTMQTIKGTYFYNMSLDAACMLVGIESSKDDISGPQVTQVYYEEGVERIAKYCNKDVIDRLIEVFFLVV